MKKDIPYRDQLLELSKLYKIPEVKSYIRSRKNLTTSQLELILLKNKPNISIQKKSTYLSNKYKKIVYIKFFHIHPVIASSFLLLRDHLYNVLHLLF